MKEGKNPLQLDSRKPDIRIEDFAYEEARFKMLTLSRPTEAKELMRLAQHDAAARWSLYEQLAAMDYGKLAEFQGSEKKI
jgi:pyruvate-ferredoxin/flavodoxin oxidoreductase